MDETFYITEDDEVIDEYTGTKDAFLLYFNEHYSGGNFDYHT